MYAQIPNHFCAKHTEPSTQQPTPLNTLFDSLTARSNFWQSFNSYLGLHLCHALPTDRSPPAVSFRLLLTQRGLSPETSHYRPTLSPPPSALPRPSRSSPVGHPAGRSRPLVGPPPTRRWVRPWPSGAASPIIRPPALRAAAPRRAPSRGGGKVEEGRGGSDGNNLMSPLPARRVRKQGTSSRATF